MTTVGFDHPLYVLPFDHRGSFQTTMFGWNGALSPEQTAQIAAAKQVIYDGFRAAVAAGVPKAKAAILVDEPGVVLGHRGLRQADVVLASAADGVGARREREGAVGDLASHDLQRSYREVGPALRAAYVRTFGCGSAPRAGHRARSCPKPPGPSMPQSTLERPSTRRSRRSC